MADARINATFTASDHVTPVVKGMRSQITALGSKTGGPLGGLLGGIGGLNIGMIGLGVGVVGAVGALGDFAKQAIDDAASVAHMTSALKANVPGWNGATDAIDAFIKRGQDLAFTDDDIRASISQLVTRTHDVAKAMSITREAMDLARLKGISLADATSILGKVFSGQASAARRAGIAIDKNATSTQALAQIQKASAGQAQTYADTQAGTIARVADQFKEMEETIGRGVLNVIDDLGTAFNNLQRAMNPNLAVTQDMEAAIRKQADALGVDADAAVAFYEAQTKATEVAKANAQAIQDQAIAAEMAAHPSETLFTVQQKLGVAMADVIRVSNGVVTSTQQVADYSQSAAGVVNQYAASIKNAGQAMDDQHSHYVDLNGEMKTQAHDLRGFEGAWRGAAINIPNAIGEITAKTHAEFKTMLATDKSDLRKLIYDLNHPGQEKNLMAWLPRGIRKAQHELLVAQKSGDAVSIKEAQTYLDHLQAEYMGLTGTYYVQTSFTTGGGGGRIKVRAGGGYVGRGDTVLVGENGPEVLRMGAGGGQVTQGRGGMGGGAGTIHTHVYIDGKEVATAVSRQWGLGWTTSGSGSRN